MTGHDALQSAAGEPHRQGHEHGDETFDKSYWEERWRSGDDATRSMSAAPPNPHLIREVEALAPGSALDAGCGAGNEALWLAAVGWKVTAADISAAAIEAGAEKARAAGVDNRIDWVEADLTTWEPEELFDLVTTHYAHSSMPQLDFYERLTEWVKPGGTLLIVGHLHSPSGADGAENDPGHGHAHAHGHGQGHGHGSDHAGDPQPPDEATATAEGITARLQPGRWDVISAEETARAVPVPGGREVRLRDVVVRAQRRR